MSQESLSELAVPGRGGVDQVIAMVTPGIHMVHIGGQGHMIEGIATIMVTGVTTAIMTQEGGITGIMMIIQPLTPQDPVVITGSIHQVRQPGVGHNNATSIGNLTNYHTPPPPLHKN